MQYILGMVFGGATWQLITQLWVTPAPLWTALATAVACIVGFNLPRFVKG